MTGERFARAIERGTQDANGWELIGGNAVCRGRYNVATIESGIAGSPPREIFGVYAFANSTGALVVWGEFKTVGAALRNGHMWANSNYLHDRSPR
ncbi:hypothetical protein [Nocardia alni]|uniref:hypothetical protein n=1 Tax=Nocardia alni TaxID=2815723 RepID=UPI001C232856|nr:hypothetical protein [Nocardia alni]